MTDRSTRALRQSTGYIVSPKETSSRAFRAARRLTNKQKLVSKKNTTRKNDEPMSEANSASSQQSNNKRQQVRKKPLNRDDLQSIGKKMRRCVEKESIMMEDREVNQIENTTCDNNSNNVHIPSLVPKMIHTSISNKDERKGTTGSYSANNTSPDEEIIAKLVGELDDIDVNALVGAIDDNTSLGSLGSSIPTNNENEYTNTRSIASRMSSTTSNGTCLQMNNDNHSNFTQKYNTTRTKETIENVDDIITCFKLSKYTKTNLPSGKDCKEENLKIRKPKKYANLISTLVKCIKKLVEISCPGPNHNDVISSLVTTKKLSNSNSKADTYNNDTTLVGRNRNTYTISDSDLLKSVVQSAFDVMKASPRGSVQRRAVRALLVGAISKTSILKDLADYFKQPRIDNGTSYAYAKKDFETMISGAALSKIDFSRKSVNDDIIEDAVSFLLNRDNITTVSWGNIDCVLSENETVVLPKITRRATRKVLWERYREVHTEQGDQYLKRTSMYKIMKAITRSGQKILSSVDYVQSLLVNDTIENIQKMIDDLIVDTIEKECLENYLESLSVFLKYNFNHHVKIDNDDSTTHGVKFILGNPLRTSTCTNTTRNTKINITCAHCKFPFFFVDQLKTSIVSNNSNDSILTNEEIENCLNVLDDAQEKFILYMGHRSRCTNQRISIKSVEENFKQLCIESKGNDVRGVLVMDFKMKFNPIHSRESTIDHYGKRGISWHGFCLIYYMYDDVNIDATRHCVYLDQILSDGNKQDTYCVISLLEAGLKQIHNDLPFIKSIVLQSDNARCYENHLLILGISIFNNLYYPNIYVSEFVHTETQDGKTLLDAHFASCARFLLHFMKTWKKNKVTRINTPRGLGFALGWNGGMANVMVQVVQTDKSRLVAIEKKLEPIIKQLKKYFGRVNHIYFTEPAKETDTSCVDHRDKCSNLTCIDDMVFEIAVQLFSNVDRKLFFNIDIENKSVTPDDVTLSEINASLRGDAILDSASSFEDTVSVASTGSSNRRTMPNKGNVDNSQQVEDFTILDLGESDNDSDYEPEESDSESDSEDIISGWNVTDIERRTYGVPNESKYGQNMFLTNVNIQQIMELGPMRRKVHKFSRKDGKRKNLRRIHRNDVIARAVRFAHEKVMTGEADIRNFDTKDPLLEDALEFEVPLSDRLEKGWGRRCKLKEGGTYGRKYIEQYKDEIIELFDKGNKESSHKMNPAMMREFLLEKYPKTYSIPGETEIKQQINAFVQNDKNKKSNKATNPKRRQDWLNILEEVVQNFKLGTPEELYNLFLQQIVVSGTNSLKYDIPDKASIKRKISTLKSKYKNIAHHAIL